MKTNPKTWITLFFSLAALGCEPLSPEEEGQAPPDETAALSGWGSECSSELPEVARVPAPIAARPDTEYRASEEEKEALVALQPLHEEEPSTPEVSPELLARQARYLEALDQLTRETAEDPSTQEARRAALKQQFFPARGE